VRADEKCRWQLGLVVDLVRGVLSYLFFKKKLHGICRGNVIGITFVLGALLPPANTKKKKHELMVSFLFFFPVESALRANQDAHPPLNMHRSLIFNGVFVMVPMLFIFLMKGKQVRKEMDEKELLEERVEMMGSVSPSA
jgi:hypothetical protein